MDKLYISNFSDGNHIPRITPYAPWMICSYKLYAQVSLSKAVSSFFTISIVFCSQTLHRFPLIYQKSNIPIYFSTTISISFISHIFIVCYPYYTIYISCQQTFTVIFLNILLSNLSLVFKIHSFISPRFSLHSEAKKIYILTVN